MQLNDRQREIVRERIGDLLAGLPLEIRALAIPLFVTIDEQEAAESIRMLYDTAGTILADVYDAEQE